LFIDILIIVAGIVVIFLSYKLICHASDRYIKGPNYRPTPKKPRS
jgi:hypothetical protein